mmetsp:Transcript_33384/g.72996  ORF Transcript_33384/g.72996 Transcript_33384/m.72996 type:complete len:353 (-) Transcript_33384:28-1086(-)
MAPTLGSPRPASAPRCPSIPHSLWELRHGRVSVPAPGPGLGQGPGPPGPGPRPFSSRGIRGSKGREDEAEAVSTVLARLAADAVPSGSGGEGSRHLSTEMLINCIEAVLLKLKNEEAERHIGAGFSCLPGPASAAPPEGTRSNGRLSAFLEKSMPAAAAAALGHLQAAQHRSRALRTEAHIIDERRRQLEALNSRCWSASWSPRSQKRAEAAVRKAVEEKEELETQLHLATQRRNQLRQILDTTCRAERLQWKEQRAALDERRSQVSAELRQVEDGLPAVEKQVAGLEADVVTIEKRCAEALCDEQLIPDTEERLNLLHEEWGALAAKLREVAALKKSKARAKKGKPRGRNS